MNTITVAGRNIEVHEWGCLVNHSDWNEEVAEAMARADGIELTPDHWEVINLVREYYEEYQCAPAVRVLPKTIGKKLGPDKGNNKYLYGLFAQGPAKQAGGYAGLPQVSGGTI